MIEFNDSDTQMAQIQRIDVQNILQNTNLKKLSMRFGVFLFVLLGLSVVLTAGVVVAAYEGYMGLVCEKPGFEEFSIRPNLGMLNQLHLEAKTASGIIGFNADGNDLTVTFPENMKGYIYLENGEKQQLTSGECIVYRKY